MNALKHIAAILVLPGTVTGLIPFFILASSGGPNFGWWTEGQPNQIPIMLGSIVIVLGLFLMFQTISLFINVGKGTLAPWMPTQHLVVRGIYRNVRNPMITGVFCILVGEAILFRSWGVFVWFVIVVLINAIYIPLVEESGLEERFGAEYTRYKQNVPRWIPRLRPWEEGAQQ